MWFKLALSVLLVIAPFSANAAGFAKASLFLSKNPATEGDTVFIHAVVTNDTTAAFSGEVVFKEGEDRIGAAAVSIAPGGAEAASVSWQPTKGSHNVTAELTGKDGAVSASEKATFAIQEKPESPAAASAAIEPSTKIKEVVAGISPAAADAATPVFGTIDSLRQKGVDALEKSADWTKNKIGGGEVKGASTDSPDEIGGVVNTATTVGATLLLYLLSILTFLLSNAGVFYPALAAVFLFALWRIFRRIRRPRY